MKPMIRKATEADAAAIAGIGKNAFYDAFAFLFQRQEELWQYLQVTYDPERIEKSIAKPNNVYFLALINGTAAGFAKLKKSSYHKEVIALDQSELQKIYVLPAYQGKGAGQCLMDAVIGKAVELEADQLWLDLHVSNDKARHFYQKNGFKKAGDSSFRIGTQTFFYHIMALPVQLFKSSDYGSN